ncbi:hypothetical protein FJ959_10010 [Mesorhizobium sp. B2-2-4]|uniref:hypothetical protein n=1 Tax=unclassified Mesorhizobium TaxID=325217 RepID=UPI00112C0117|nr:MULTISPECIES: hypothetical protein [unclassified Mesorhizobium]TPM59191.1 hypothetical protein FJ959_10010 [Mesorhizobium sp. B2-2-4]TPM67676.1 hypothetical protein FJ965_11150 [Mesorhizobium sp. B2-2-1]TPN66957.1 hypothetical protein FJ984_16010 [Mesorhizobium sp. B1-1-3]
MSGTHIGSGTAGVTGNQRDLAPTSDVRAVLKGLLADQFGLSAAVLVDKVFPESATVKPMRDLVV